VDYTDRLLALSPAFHSGASMKLHTLLVAVISLGMGADDTKNPSDLEKDKLQGTWIVESIEVDGKPLDGELIKDATIAFSGDLITAKFQDQSKLGKFRLDATKKPKEIDLLNDDATADKKEVDRGIYQLEGDALKLCLGGATKSRSFGDAEEKSTVNVRPKAFDSRQGALAVLKRKK
jgi:uncharacterized protein (TIGR03067 family)